MPSAAPRRRLYQHLYVLVRNVGRIGFMVD